LLAERHTGKKKRKKPEIKKKERREQYLLYETSKLNPEDRKKATGEGREGTNRCSPTSSD